MISFREQAGGLSLGLSNFPRQAARNTRCRRCLTEGNNRKARLASGTCKPLPAELPSPSISQLPIRQTCPAAGGRLETDLLEGSGKGRRVKGTLLPNLYSLSHTLYSTTSHGVSTQLRSELQPIPTTRQEGEIQGQQPCTSLNKAQTSSTAIEICLRK